MDETVVGAAPTRWTTAGMKREDGMQGYWSVAVDEKHPSLAVDDEVGVAAPTRWTTVGMKREDGIQGSRSEAVDERGRSLVMDDGGGVSAPAWWRRTAVDGVANGGGRSDVAVGWTRPARMDMSDGAEGVGSRVCTTNFGGSHIYIGRGS